MNKDFDWLKWVGLFTIISILAAVVYLVQNNKKSEMLKFNDEIEQVAIAAHENQIDVGVVKDKLPLNVTINLDQTNNFIKRVEQIQLSDSLVDLENTPDVAHQSRIYNALIDEAVNVYGDVDISNSFRYCTIFVETANNLWRLKYSPSNDLKFDQNALQSYTNTLKDAKRACLEDVTAASK